MALQVIADCTWAMIGSGAPPAARSLTHPFAGSVKENRQQQKKQVQAEKTTRLERS
jgi:hypothetical protein